jgi:hypothetical protein
MLFEFIDNANIRKIIQTTKRLTNFTPILAKFTPILFYSGVVYNAIIAGIVTVAKKSITLAVPFPKAKSHNSSFAKAMKATNAKASLGGILNIR